MRWGKFEPVYGTKVSQSKVYEVCVNLEDNLFRLHSYLVRYIVSMTAMLQVSKLDWRINQSQTFWQLILVIGMIKSADLNILKPISMEEKKRGSPMFCTGWGLQLFFRLNFPWSDYLSIHLTSLILFIKIKGMFLLRSKRAGWTETVVSLFQRSAQLVHRRCIHYSASSKPQAPSILHGEKKWGGQRKIVHTYKSMTEWPGLLAIPHVT